MGFKVNIVADSLSPKHFRLTTMEVTYPRPIHCEFLRHRVFSRCAASSRAIPVRRFISQVLWDPYIPSHWGSNKPGMQAGADVGPLRRWASIKVWRLASLAAVVFAWLLSTIGIHKQLANRLLEPFQWMTEIITATEWDNFFHLRIHKDAHPDIRRIAEMMYEAMQNSVPVTVSYGEWHLPKIGREDYPLFSDEQKERVRDVSVGRVAQASYLRLERGDASADIARQEKMLRSHHMSPFESVARPMTEEELEVFEQWSASYNGGVVYARDIFGLPQDSYNRRCTHFCGNFNGWIQYRKELKNEFDPIGAHS